MVMAAVVKNQVSEKKPVVDSNCRLSMREKTSRKMKRYPVMLMKIKDQFFAILG